MASSHSVDEALLLRHDLKLLFIRDIPLRTLTDFSSLFNPILQSMSTMERHLIIDSRAAREAFNRKDVAEIGWIGRAGNISAALTEPVPCLVMMQLLTLQRLQNKILQ